MLLDENLLLFQQNKKGQPCLGVAVLERAVHVRGESGFAKNCSIDARVPAWGWVVSFLMMRRRRSPTEMCCTGKFSARSAPPSPEGLSDYLLPKYLQHLSLTSRVAQAVL
jgi:hypothetical protein